MIFKNPAESANLLSQKIREEIGSNFTLAYINPDCKNYSELVARNLNLKLNFLPDLVIHWKLEIGNWKLVITDDGSTNAQEYNEFTDKIRKSFPQTEIILAIPVIPESEKTTLTANCDTLLYLHADPYFFSINQFYQKN